MMLLKTWWRSCVPLNPISTRGDRLCPPNTTGTPGFSDPPTALQLLAKEDLRMTKFLQLHKCISLINLYWRSLKGYRWNWNSLTKRQTTFNKHWNFATPSQREKVEYIIWLHEKQSKRKMFFLGHPKILADQLTLFNHEWDRLCPPH